MGFPIMDIKRINVYHVSLPFNGNFPHSRSEGGYADNVICEIVAENGSIKGYGEGAPRSYVTGETPQSIFSDISRLSRIAAFPRCPEHISQIRDFVDAAVEAKAHNAAVCALETALLDFFGKCRRQYLTEYFPKDHYTDTISYGAVVPLWNGEGIEHLCRQILEMAIDRIKLKMGKDFNQNKTGVEIVRNVFKNGCDLKVDVNGVWNREDAFNHIPLIRHSGIRVVEQPMMPNDPSFPAFAREMLPLGIYLMADESLCSIEDIEKITAQGYNMVNVRLSKCGGFHQSLKIIDRLRKERIRFQIGCHLGESGILSSAGRILSLLCRDAWYHDGSYDAFLLKENVTKKPVTFNRKGIAGALEGFGLGVDVDLGQLERLSREFAAFDLP
ncbi:MAG: enolase C-terminal domain-like protein [Thermodesulfobacteriota bacterium]